MRQYQNQDGHVKTSASCASVDANITEASLSAASKLLLDESSSASDIAEECSVTTKTSGKQTSSASKMQSKFQGHLRSILQCQTHRTSLRLYQAHTSYDKYDEYNAALGGYAELMGMNRLSWFHRLNKKSRSDGVAQQSQRQQQNQRGYNDADSKQEDRIISLREDRVIGDTIREIEASRRNDRRRGDRSNQQINYQRSRLTSIHLLWKGPIVQPSISSYTLVAHALSSDFHRIGARKAKRLLEQLLSRVEEMWQVELTRYRDDGRKDNTLDLSLCPTTELITIVVDALAKMGDGSRAQDILFRMERTWNEIQQLNANADDSELYRPTLGIYEAVIRALSHPFNWSKQIPPDGEGPADRVNALLRRMESGMNSSARPLVSTYNEAIKSYSRGFVSNDKTTNSSDSTNHFNPSTHAMATLSNLQTLYNATHDPLLRPTMETFTAVISAYSKSHGGLKAAHTARALLDVALLSWKDEDDDKDETSQSITALYTSVMDAYARCGGEEAAVIVEELLDRMERGVDGAPKPNEWTYTAGKIVDIVIFNVSLDVSSVEPFIPLYLSSAVIKTLARSGRPSAIHKAEDILQRMDTPDTFAYSCLIHHWAQSEEEGAALHADRLLMKLHRIAETVSAENDRDAEEDDHGLYDRQQSINGRKALQPPDAMAHATVIHSYARATSPEEVKIAPDRSLDLLRRLVDSLFQNPRQRNLPDVMGIFNTVLHICGRSGAGEKAEEVLDLLLSSSNHPHQSLPSIPLDRRQLNCTQYTFVIDSWANSGDPNAGQKALRMLRRLEEAGLEPNARCISSAIEAVSKSDDNEGVLDLVKRLVTLNKLGDDSTIINSRTFTKAITSGNATNALGVMSYLDEICDKRLGPNTQHVNAVISALSQSNIQGKDQMAFQLFHRMKEEYKDGNVALRPDVITYTTMISMIADSCEGNACDRAEQLLHEMQDAGIAPTTRVFNAVFQAFCNSDIADAGDRTLALLARLDKLYEEGNRAMKPDIITYTVVCNALRHQSDASSRAMWLLQRVDSDGCKPDLIFYTAIVRLLCKDKHQGSMLKAEEILQRMDAAYEAGETSMQPDNYVINLVRRFPYLIRYFDPMLVVHIQLHFVTSPAAHSRLGTEYVEEEDSKGIEVAESTKVFLFGIKLFL